MSPKIRAFSWIIAAAICALTVGEANAQDRSRAGVLSCTTGVGIGLILGSTKSIDCVFNPEGPASPQKYTGRLNKIGLDIGITGGTVIKWWVFGGARSGAPSVPYGALAGRWGGVSAEGTLGLGVGGNVLVGGTNEAYVLQPLSVQGQVGLNIALGVSGLTLRSVN